VRQGDGHVAPGPGRKAAAHPAEPMRRDPGGGSLYPGSQASCDGPGRRVARAGASRGSGRRPGQAWASWQMARSRGQPSPCWRSCCASRGTAAASLGLAPVGTVVGVVASRLQPVVPAPVPRWGGCCAPESTTATSTNSGGLQALADPSFPPTPGRVGAS
jgi:hypothetical protein